MTPFFRQIGFFFIALMMLALPARAQIRSLDKIQDDDDTKYTDVGKIALTITNFGTIGTRNRYWPNQPSCEYPIGSRVEHIYQGGLWVGGQPRKRPQPLVTTAVTDRYGSTTAGILTDPYEFASAVGEKITTRSSLSLSRNFNESAVSHLDFVCDFSDTLPANNHAPMNIAVHQESYAWNFPFAEHFVFLSYTIRNISADTLDTVYVGYYNSATVRNTNYVRPGTTGYFNYGGFGYDSLNRMMYAFEFQGSPGNSPANSYVGVSLVGATPFPHSVDSLGDLYKKSYFNAWQFRGNSGSQAYFSPTDDYKQNDPYLSRFGRLSNSLTPAQIAPLRTSAGNYAMLLSAGPFPSLAPGDSLTVVFAVVCAKMTGTELEQFDKPAQREDLYDHLAWAVKAYKGEDINGNNRIDAGEDLDGNGRVNHFVMPSPPRQPAVRVELEDRQAVVYWDKASAEESVDPISKRKDFEGYRVYRSTPGADFLANQDLLLSLSLAGEFDRSDDSVGYNSGFGNILLPSPVTFPGDTNKYWYRFPPVSSGATHLSGWQYVYGVSAFDQGEPLSGVASLESAASRARVVPGTLPTSDLTKEVTVYPNPYNSHAFWDGSGERLRKIYFRNLPARSTITIYTIAGDIVAVVNHDAATYQGDDIAWFDKFGDRTQAMKFSGGEHAWDLISKYDQAIATGLYLFTVKDESTGDIRKGKFVIIK